MKVVLSGAGVVMLAMLLCVPACARVENQDATSDAEEATTPRTPDGKPDLGGVWATAEGRFAQRPTEDTNVVRSVFASRTGGLYAMEIDGHIS